MMIQILSDGSALETAEDCATTLAKAAVSKPCLLALNWPDPGTSSKQGSSAAGNVPEIVSSTIDLSRQPDLLATFLDTLGQVYIGLGQYQQARGVLQQAVALRECLLGDRHPLVATSKVYLAGALRRLSETRIAGKHAQDAVDINTTVFGAESVPVAEALNELAAIQLQDNQLAAADDNAKRGERILAAHNDRRVTLLKDTRARVLEACEKYDVAVKIYEKEVLEIDKSTCFGTEHPRYAMHLHNLATIYLAQSRIDEAERAFSESYRLLRRAFGPRHPELADVLKNLGRLARGKSDSAAAEKYFRDALQLDQELRGPDHPNVGYDFVNLAYIDFERGSYKSAETPLRQALAIFEAKLPEVHSYTATALVLLGRVLIEQDRCSEAEELLRRAVASFSSLFKQCAGNRDEAAIDLAWAQAVYGRALDHSPEGKKLLLQAQTVIEKILGSSDMYAQKIRKWLA